MARKAVYSLVTLFLLLSIFIYFGSQDAETIDDQGLSALIESVPESENGFRHIAFIQNEEFKVFSHSSDRQKLIEHTDGNIWDENWVSNTLHNKRVLIDSAITATETGRFHFGSSYDFKNVINYQELTSLNHLLLLRSIQHSRNKEPRKALELSNNAVQFAQEVKTEGSSTLISFIIGINMQQAALQSQERLLKENAFLPEDYQQTLNILDNISIDADRLFSKITSGELLFARNVIKNFYAESFKERWKLYFGLNKNKLYEEQLTETPDIRDKPPISGRVSDFMFMIMPGFYYHKKREFNIHAKYLKSVHDDIISGCKNFNVESSNRLPTLEHSILGLFTPNSVGLGTRTPLNAFYKDYQLQHCLNRLQIEANKLILTANWAFNDKGEKIEALNELQIYMENTRAIDPFSDGSLVLSRDGAAISSVGTSISDKQNKEVQFHKDCHKEEPCYNNPRFSLYKTTVD